MLFILFLNPLSPAHTLTHVKDSGVREEVQLKIILRALKLKSSEYSI